MSSLISINGSSSATANTRGSMLSSSSRGSISRPSSASAATDANFAVRRGIIPCQPIGPIPTNRSGANIILTASSFVT